jgi:cytochrome c-type biogenesis protein CcmE
MTLRTHHLSLIAHHGFFTALALAAALALSGCDYLPFGYTPIKEIAAAPGPFEGKEVRIKGQVRDPIQLLGLRTFVLADETGEITVTTAGALPAAGSEAAVKGVVKSAVIVSGKSIGLRVEETQRLR